jgi:chromosome segregation ATPase
MSSLNINVAQTSAALEELTQAYSATKDAMSSEPTAHNQVVENMNALHAELSSLKQTVRDLNTKYADILGAMKS